MLSYKIFGCVLKGKASKKWEGLIESMQTRHQKTSRAKSLNQQKKSWAQKKGRKEKVFMKNGKCYAMTPMVRIGEEFGMDDVSTDEDGFSKN